MGEGSHFHYGPHRAYELEKKTREPHKSTMPASPPSPNSFFNRENPETLAFMVSGIVTHLRQNPLTVGSTKAAVLVLIIAIPIKQLEWTTKTAVFGSVSRQRQDLSAASAAEPQDPTPTRRNFLEASRKASPNHPRADLERPHRCLSCWEQSTEKDVNDLNGVCE